jgi:hypothetical protein
MKRILISSLILCASLSLSAQETSDTIRKDALNVYMDASDYIRKEIPYVNYVRDIRDAGLYIISTSETTGSGGREYTYFFIGQNEFEGIRDTLSYTSNPDETTEIIRENQVRTIKMGLTRYVARTPLGKFLTINFSKPLTETINTDKWDSWVFKTSVSGYASGEQSYKSAYLNGNFSANRVTEELKTSISAQYSYSVDKFEIDEDIITSEHNSKSVSGLLVKSITDHWSAGGSFYVGASNYSNTKLSLNILPGIEYDLFPYSESTRRQLRFTYKAGFNYMAYIDTTIYNKVTENLWRHSLSINYEIIQKWGSADITLEYSNYLHDWSKNNISLNGFMSLRVAKGLSLNFGGGAAIVHDQLGLVKGGATQQEVLLRLRELETQFEYFTTFGVTYTFGSIYNNVVNPRFGSIGGGGMTIIMN